MGSSTKMRSPDRPTLALAAYFVLLAALIWSGYDFYSDQERRFEEEAENQLRAIADLKAAQLSDWRNERISDGEVVRAGSEVVPALELLFRHPVQARAIADVANWMNSVKASHGYSNVIALDKEGNVHLSLGEETSVSGDCLTAAKDAMCSRRVILADLHRESRSGSIHLSMAVPILMKPDRDAGGVLLLWMDPNRSLYPNLQSWPTPSQTGESLLVRRQGDSVLFLNALKHRSGAALTFSLPLNSGTPAAMAALGREGVWTARDYRGVQVLAAARKVPGSPWHLIVKVDADEVHTPGHQRSVLLSIMLLLFLLASGPALALVWYRQGSRIRTVQRESEVARKALIDHYSYLSRHANDIILLEDEHGKIIEANERAEQTYGYTHQELLGLTARDLVDPDSLMEYDSRWQMSPNPQGFRYEIVHRRKDGSSFPVEISARVIQVDGESFRQKIVRDITERRKNEERIRRAGAYNRRLIEASLDPLVTINPEGRIADANEATEKVTGYSRDELLGTDFSDYFTDPDRARQAYQLAFREGSIRNYDLEIRHRDGRITPVTYNASVYRDKTGEVVGVFAAARDITERMRIHTELERLNQELETRVHLRTAELEAANKELEAFTYSVSHDLRSPLRAIHGFSRILAEQHGGQLASGAHRCLDLVRQNAIRMGELIEDLLALSRLSRQSLRLHTVACGDLVRQALEELADQREERTVEVRIGELAACEADPLLLKQVWLNLLSNAFKYSRKRENALIQVGCSTLARVPPPLRDGDSGPCDPNRVVYYVSDNGAGFDMQYAGKLFGVFQRLHSLAEYDGTGVGLAIVDRILRRHGGRIWAVGREGHGATFFFTTGDSS